MATVLIVEDDDDMGFLMSERLGRDYDVLRAANGAEALELLREKRVDLAVADVMMPVMDGYEFLKRLRTDGIEIPVILVTAKQSISDKRDGFSVGADDYMTKPIVFEELVWRIEALLRRAKISAAKEIRVGAFRMDESTGEVEYRNRPLELAKKEFQLVYKLLSYPNKLFSKEKLMEDVWGYDSDSDDTTVRTHMNRIRNKLADVTEFEIATVRGLGYKAVMKEGK